MSAGGNTEEQAGWPLLQAERHWGSGKLFMVLLVAACASWCYIIGEYVGYYLGPKMGFAAMTAGAMVGMLLVTLAVVPVATRYGIDSIAGSKPQFGSRGWMVTVFLQYASIIGWNALLLIFFGKSLAQLLLLTGVEGEGAAAWTVPLVTLLACGAVFLALLKGATGLERVSVVLFFFIVGVGAWIVWLLVANKLGALAEAKPQYASESRIWNYTTGVELGIASLLSWWPYIGAMVRQSRNASTATVPAMLGMGMPVPLLSVIGLLAILALQTSDPTAWLVELGGPVYGGVALVFVAAANFGTVLAGIYATAVGLRQVPALANARWSLLLAASIVPVAVVGVVIPDLFFSNFGSFLSFIGITFGPVCAIQIVDFMLLRGQRISVRGLYVSGPGTPYHYWGGFNIAALVAMVAGVGTYLYLLNPLTYESRFPYEYLTATLPTCVVSGAVYAMLTVAWVRPSGRGGYG